MIHGFCCLFTNKNYKGLPWKPKHIKERKSESWYHRDPAYAAMLIMANYAPHPLPPLATDPSTDLSEVRLSKVSKWASKENKSEKSTMLKYQYGNTITKTYLYNFDPLKPHFHFSKTGFQGYALFFLFLLKTIDSAYSLEPPRRGGSNEYPQSIF